MIRTHTHNTKRNSGINKNKPRIERREITYKESIYDQIIVINKKIKCK